MKAVRGRLFRGGFEDVGREGRGDGLLGSPPGASGGGRGGIGESGAGGGPGGGGRGSGAPSPLRPTGRPAWWDGVSHVVTRPGPRARHPTREHVTQPASTYLWQTCSRVK